MASQSHLNIEDCIEMKTSLYNSFLNIQDKHTLIFNAMNMRFVVIKDRVIDETYFNSNLDVLNDTLFSQFCEAGILISDDIDEVSVLDNMIRRNDNNSSEFILHINPTLACNFHCWYCYEKHLPDSRMSENVLNRVKLFISGKLHDENINHLELGFFGGEPFLFFNEVVLPIIEHSASICDCNNKDLHIHFTTNGSLLNRNIIEFLSRFNCGFQITLDGGKKHHDKTRFFKNGEGSYASIIENIKLLAHYKIMTIVRINYTSNNIDSITEILNDFGNFHYELRPFIQFDFQRVWQDRLCLNDETDIIANVFRKKTQNLGFHILSNYIENNVRNSCYGDKINHCLINFDGKVFGCTARDFTIDNELGFIDEKGNIEYYAEKLKERHSSKFSKSICKSCRIAPLCGGGCKQRAYEGRVMGTCTFNYSEEDKDNIIFSIFEHSYL